MENIKHFDMRPFISIILPTFNSKSYVSDTIQSVLNQTYKNYELLIIDDYSVDQTKDFIKQKYKNSKVRLIDKNLPKGVSFSRQLGFTESKGEFICFLDSDDLWMPNKLEEQLNFMIKNQFVFSSTSIIRKNINKEKYFTPPFKNTFNSVQKTNPLHTSSIMIKKEILDKKDFIHMGYDDFILWINILKKGYECYNLNKPLCIYKVDNENSLSSNYLRALYWNVLIQIKIIKPNIIGFIINILSYISNAIKKRI